MDTFLQPGKTLAQRAARGVVWMSGLRLVEGGLRLVRLSSLARLLGPQDFGLMGMALLVLAILETFTMTGFDAALIQKRHYDNDYLDTGWTVQVLRGIGLCVLLIATAPHMAQFFGEPDAAHLIRGLALGVLFKGFRNIGVVSLQKELDFPKQVIYHLVVTVADLLATVGAALILRNAWALVLGWVSAGLVGLVVSFLLHPYRPRIRIAPAQARELFGFGRWMLAGNVLFFLIMQGDDFFVGRFLGASALGFYQMAYVVSNLPATEITGIINQVTFPAFSKLQDDLGRLRDAYLQALQITAFVSMPLAGGIFVFAADITELFLGAKWMPMVPAMQVLAVWGFIRSIGATSSPPFLALGRPDLSTKVMFGKFILLALMIWPLTARLGILGTALAVVLNAVVINPIAEYTLVKVIGLDISELAKAIGLPILNTALAAIALGVARAHLLWSRGLIRFLTLAGLGAVLYLAATCLCQLVFKYGALRTIYTRLQDLSG